jgi:hypothetical protein
MGRRPKQPVKRTTRSVSTRNQDTILVSTENQKKTFSDLTNKSWFTEGEKIKVGENLPELLSGKGKILEVKEILIGDVFKSWKIVIDTEEKIHLLKSSRELK